MSQTTQMRFERLDPETLTEVIELVKRTAPEKGRYDAARGHRLRAVVEYLLMPARESVRQFQAAGLLVEPPELARARRKAVAKIASGRKLSANDLANASALAGDEARAAASDAEDQPAAAGES